MRLLGDDVEPKAATIKMSVPMQPTQSVFFSPLQRFAYLVVLSMATASVLAEGGAVAKASTFSGTWEIDLRTPTEQKSRSECRTAAFELHQSGDKISGSHSFATPNCGRANEGGEGTVKGYVLGQTAFLVVTSARNGAIVMGRANKVGNSLHWRVLDEIKSGEPPRDSALILHHGMLLRSPIKQ